MGRSLRSTCPGLVVRFDASERNDFHFPLAGPDTTAFWTAVHARWCGVDGLPPIGKFHSLSTDAVLPPHLCDLLRHAGRFDRRISIETQGGALACAVHSTLGIHVFPSATSVPEQRSRGMAWVQLSELLEFRICLDSLAHAQRRGLRT